MMLYLYLNYCIVLAVKISIWILLYYIILYYHIKAVDIKSNLRCFYLQQNIILINHSPNLNPKQTPINNISLINISSINQHSSLEALVTLQLNHSCVRLTKLFLLCLRTQILRVPPYHQIVNTQRLNPVYYYVRENITQHLSQK